MAYFATIYDQISLMKMAFGMHLMGMNNFLALALFPAATACQSKPDQALTEASMANTMASMKAPSPEQNRAKMDEDEAPMPRQ